MKRAILYIAVFLIIMVLPALAVWLYLDGGDGNSNASDKASVIKIGAIFDLTGGLSIYGKQQSQALHLAVDSINENGGINGNHIEVVEQDARSELSTYSQYTNNILSEHPIKGLFAGLTSASREVIRPIVRYENIPYFYSSLYEGGACDKQTFITGGSASQLLSVLMKWAIEKYGPKIYIMAPDYNFGTISAHWIHQYAKQFGGDVLGEDFLSLSVTDYSSIIDKIKALKPDFVVTLPVGDKQTQFIEQFSSAGLKEHMGLVSTNYGSGNQQMTLSSASGDGVITIQAYFMSVAEPENVAFMKKWQDKYGLDEPIVSIAANVWNAVHLWAAAVAKADTIENTAIIQALESGLSFEGPNGLVTMQPSSHHLKQNVYIVRGNRQQSFDVVKAYTAVAPSFEDTVCDLIKQPDTVEHYTPVNSIEPSS